MYNIIQLSKLFYIEHEINIVVKLAAQLHIGYTKLD